jgi:hypothetical protein
MRPPAPVDPPPDVEDAVALLGIAGARTRAVPWRHGPSLILAFALGLGGVAAAVLVGTGMAAWDAAASAATVDLDVDGRVCGGPYRICTATIETRTGISIPDGAHVEASGEDDGRTWLEPSVPPSTWVRLCAPDPEPLIAEARAHASTATVEGPCGGGSTRLLVRGTMPG